MSTLNTPSSSGPYIQGRSSSMQCTQTDLQRVQNSQALALSDSSCFLSCSAPVCSVVSTHAQPLRLLLCCQLMGTASASIQTRLLFRCIRICQQNVMPQRNEHGFNEKHKLKNSSQLIWGLILTPQHKEFTDYDLWTVGRIKRGKRC